MSFFPDCSRSVKRLPQGKTLLRNIREAGVPAATVVKNGFTIRALSLDDVEKISISAPAGLVVMCSHADGISVYRNEYWLEAISPPTDLHIVTPFPAVEIEYPELRYFPFAVYEGNNSRENNKATPAINESRSFCVPAVVPFYNSEALLYSVSFLQDLLDYPYYVIDDQGNEVFYQNQAREELFIDSYGGNGRIDKPMGIVRGEDYVYYSNSWTIQHLPGHASVWYYGADRLLYDNDTYSTTAIAWVAKINTPKDISFTLLGPYDMWLGLPDDLYFAISGYFEQSSVRIAVKILGSYSCVIDGHITILSVVQNTPYGYPIWSWYSDPETAHEHRQWRLFYSVYTEGVGSVVVPGYLIFPTLSAIHGVPNQAEATNINWSFIEKAMSQLVPFPNVNHYNQTPHDSIMFHGPGGIYTWTRNNGKVKFSAGGLQQVDMVMPADVSEPFVRPNITYASTVDGTDYYLCVCQEVGEAVRGVYIGSPFTGEWEQLPSIDEHEILHIQPVTVDDTKVILLGIAKKPEDDPEVADKHFVVFLSRQNGIGEWKLLSEIDAPQSGGSWAMAFYGDETITQLMRAYPSQPAATAQPWHLTTYPPVTF